MYPEVGGSDAGVPMKHATYQVVLPIIYLHWYKGRCGRVGLG